MVTLFNMTSQQMIIMDYNGPYLIWDIDWGQVGAQHSTNTFFNQVGANIVGTKWGTRSIKIIGYIVGSESEIKSHREFLASMVNLNDYIKVTYDGKFIIGKPKETIRWGKNEEENNEVMCKFYIELFCEYPLFKSEQIQQVNLSNWENNLEFPLEIPMDNITNPEAKYPAGTEFEILGENTVKEINVEGHVCTPFTIEFEARGDVVNPSFTHVGKQQAIKLGNSAGDFTMLTGDKIIINTEPTAQSIILVRDNEEINIFKNRNKISKLDMNLCVGSNFVVFGADSGELFLGAIISFYNRYLEVNWRC